MSEKQLFAKFQTEDILVEQGRLLFAVLYAFTLSGYRVFLHDSLNRERLGRCGKLVPEMQGVTVTRTPPSNPEDCIYLFDEEDRSLAKLNWRKKVQVRDDLFSSYCLKSPMIMPYAMHPRQTSPEPDQRLEQLRAQNRKMRVFFSGDTKDYGRNRIRYPAPKLPRLEIINTLRENMAEDVILVQDAATRDGLRTEEVAYTKRCVIMDTSRIWVEEPEWLGTLADADFFLSPPGIVMPMCHNIIEAMAVGTIPITNYPEWLQPRLTHMENCIVFHNKDDLIKKIRSVLKMDTEQIIKMRANVLRYYEAHLNPSSFINKLESRPEKKIVVLLYTEGNVARSWAKLKKNSILMRGQEATADLGWASCLFRKLIP